MQDVKPRVVTVIDHVIQRLADSNNKVVNVVLSMLLKVPDSHPNIHSANGQRLSLGSTSH